MLCFWMCELLNLGHEVTNKQKENANTNDFIYLFMKLSGQLLSAPFLVFIFN